MGYQCVPQTIGLVRGEPKAGQKNRANGAGILAEFMEERYSDSTTFDSELSYMNVYDGLSTSGIETWLMMDAEATMYRSHYVDKNGKERSRKLPKQSVIAVATIIHPPSWVTDGWTVDEYQKFEEDAFEVLEEIEPRIWSPDNMRASAVHVADEGGIHGHRAHMTMDEDGKFCGSIYDSHLRQRVAKEFAVKMRERGYDIDDPDLTDWNQYGELVESSQEDSNAFVLRKDKYGFEKGTWVTWANPEYRAEIDAKRAKQGLSQPDFDAVKTHERELVEMRQRTDEKKAELDAAHVELMKTRKKRNELKSESGELEKKINDAWDEAERKIDEYDKSERLKTDEFYQKELRRLTDEYREALEADRQKKLAELDQKQIKLDQLEEQRKQAVKQFEHARDVYEDATKRLDAMVDGDFVTAVLEEVEAFTEPEGNGPEPVYANKAFQFVNTGLKKLRRMMQTWADRQGKPFAQAIAQRVRDRVRNNKEIDELNIEGFGTHEYQDPNVKSFKNGYGMGE